MQNTPKSFATAMMEYFGKLPGQGTADFVQELKKLDERDRAMFRAELERVGYTLT